jgi:uncharacterized membrane protein YcaP (DUF421 family)
MDTILLVPVTIGVYLLIIFCLKLTGKKGLSELSVTDFVFIMLISESFDVITGEDNKFLGAIITIVTLTGVNYGLDWLTFKSKKIRTLLEGVPVIIIRNGKIVKKTMEKERLTMDNINEALRTNGLQKITDVKLGMLEEDGEISIVTKPK